MSHRVTLTPHDVAERYGVSTKTVLRHLNAGKLRGAKIGSRWQILDDDASAWFDDQVPQVDVVEVDAPTRVRTVTRRSRRGGHQGGGLRALMATEGGSV